jgi:hypothetical protein
MLDASVARRCEIAFIAALIASALASAEASGVGQAALESICRTPSNLSRLDTDRLVSFEGDSVTARLRAAFAHVERDSGGIAIVNLALINTPGTVPNLTSGADVPVFQSNMVGGWAGAALEKISSRFRPFASPNVIGIAVQYPF